MKYSISIQPDEVKSIIIDRFSIQMCKRLIQDTETIKRSFVYEEI